MRRELHLPEECWECIIKFLNSDHRSLQSLSLVSKHFLSITNRIRISLTFSKQKLSTFNRRLYSFSYSIPRPILHRLFQRYTNLTSLDLSHFSGNLETLLRQISGFQLNLTSLNLSNHKAIPKNGFRPFADNLKTLTSLIWSNIGSIRNTDLILIVDCFPFLEELDLSFPKYIYRNTDISKLTLLKLRKLNLSGDYYIDDSLLFNLCNNSKFLEEVVMFDCKYLTNVGVVSAIHERPNLKSLSISFSKNVGTMYVNSELTDSLKSLKGLTCLDLSFSRISDDLLSSFAEKGLPLKRLVLQHCSGYTYNGIFCLLSKCQFLHHLDLQYGPFMNDEQVVELSPFLGHLVSINLSECNMLTASTIFSLATNCCFLNEIRMEYTSIGEFWGNNCNFVVCPQVKSLYLAHNTVMKNKNIKIFASIFPNLQVLDMSDCYCISEGIVEVLRCCKIMNLNLASCPRLNLHGMNFHVHKLEVLNLSKSKVDDETLYVVSKSCHGLLQLNLEQCCDITEKGVRQLVENCIRLREINLRDCLKVVGDVGLWTWMMFSRPSLRKIIAPRNFLPDDSMWKLMLRHGCTIY